MAKPDTIHKDYKELKVLCTDGSHFITRSTYRSATGTMKLEIDPRVHPAWNPNANEYSAKLGQVEDFNNRFNGVNFLSQKKQ